MLLVVLFAALSLGGDGTGPPPLCASASLMSRLHNALTFRVLAALANPRVRQFRRVDWKVFVHRMFIRSMPARLGTRRCRRLPVAPTWVWPGLQERLRKCKSPWLLNNHGLWTPSPLAARIADRAIDQAPVTHKGWQEPREDMGPLPSKREGQTPTSMPAGRVPATVAMNRVRPLSYS